MQYNSSSSTTPTSIVRSIVSYGPIERFRHSRWHLLPSTNKACNTVVLARKVPRWGTVSVRKRHEMVIRTALYIGNIQFASVEGTEDHECTSSTPAPLAVGTPFLLHFCLVSIILIYNACPLRREENPYGMKNLSSSRTSLLRAISTWQFGQRLVFSTMCRMSEGFVTYFDHETTWTSRMWKIEL